MSHSSAGDNGSQARERTALHSGALRASPVPLPGTRRGPRGAAAPPGNPVFTAHGGDGLQGGIDGDTQGEPGVRMMGRSGVFFHPGVFHFA